ncbi:FAD-dependent oxidoreductase [Cloacibacterium sp.]|jgi:cation diffusion facilitator CzcD-associated flavoprotein CzcO|uniref:FAD-dependent oxidoreductase n=1 Tax=Cloacibacterium sp. TaxID=1913682 RepID=UPI0035B3DD3D
MKKVAIVGGGILGLSIGYQLSKSKGEFKISIFEKEAQIGKHNLEITMVYYVKGIIENSDNRL